MSHCLVGTCDQIVDEALVEHDRRWIAAKLIEQTQLRRGQFAGGFHQNDTNDGVSRT